MSQVMEGGQIKGESMCILSCYIKTMKNNRAVKTSGTVLYCDVDFLETMLNETGKNTEH